MGKKYLLKKLQDNSNLSRSIAKKIYSNIRINEDIFPLINNAENEIREKGKLLIEPITVEIDNIICNCSPIKGMIVKKNSCISFTIGIMDQDGSNKIKIAFARSIDNIYTNEIIQINKIINGLRNIIKYNCKIRDITDYIGRQLKNFEIGTVKNICGYALDNNRILIPNTFDMHPEFKKVFVKNQKMNHEGVYFINIFGLNVGNNHDAKATKYGTMYHFQDKHDEPRNDRAKAYLKRLKRALKTKQNIFSNGDISRLLKNKIDKSNFKYLCETGYITENPMMAVEHIGKFNVYSFHVGVSVLVEKNRILYL